jgi:hypothetical protein
MTDMAFVVRPDDPIREVVAVMPGIAGTVGRPDCAACYVHMGQHGSCSIDGIVGTHVDAGRNEYADLKDELERIGYEVYVVSIDRIGCADYADERRRQLDFDN